jgi:magnesium transporter
MRTDSVKHSLDDMVVNHMRTDVPRLNVDLTVGEALLAIREKPPENRIIYFYVVDQENRLKGVVPTRRLLLNSPASPLQEIMVKDTITISNSATVLDACEYFILHRLLAFPIVDHDGHLLGVVDVELYTDEISDFDRREGNDELFQLIGIHLDATKQTSSTEAFKSRFPWLLANVAGGLMAAFLTGVFEAELQKAVALALFIPVVLALAESVSIQSVSLALRVLSGQKPTIGQLLRKLQLEVLTGLFLGAASGAAVAIVAMLWLGQWRVAACVLGGIATSVTCAAAIGLVMPNVIRLLNREPQVASGPVALACTDMVTLLIYFSLARLLIA